MIGAVWVEQIGRRALGARQQVHRLALLVNQSAYWLFLAPLTGKGLRIRATIHQMVRVGYEAVPIVCAIAFFVGLIIALQSAYQLRRVGALMWVANLVGVSITRELGPLVTAIIVAGRSGSAYTAEIGSMKVAEELDALVTMGIHPVKFLIVPKILALLIMLPCLTVLADVLGILGGMTIAVFSLGINAASYLEQTQSALVMADLLSGLVKSMAFALIISIVGCYQGLQVSGGAESVGQRTTRSVVVSIFMVIVADCFFTLLFYWFG